MTIPTCPITGEPLLSPGQVVSQTACNRLKTATSNLADIMSIINQLIHGAGKGETAGRTQPGSKPPLSIGLLDAVDDYRDTIDIWASNLAQEVNPSLRYRPGDWQTIQAVFQQYADRCINWHHGDTEPGRLCIERVLEAVKHLERIAFPPEWPPFTSMEQQEARERLHHSALTIGPACEVIRLITGDTLKAATVRQWKRRGLLESHGEPPRYQIADLLDKLSHPRVYDHHR